MRISRKDQDYINKMIRICFLSGAMIFMGNSVYAADFSTTTLPTGASGMTGIQSISTNSNFTMDIVQSQQNAVIQWQDFSIGANAAVNFSYTEGGEFNTLNYVNSGNISNIYGSMNATNGNIYVVNTAGVIIGKSAQINVGSLYVSNREMRNTQLANFTKDATFAGTSPDDAAELMSLGNIVANKVTFDGDRVVLDVDLVVDTDGNKLMDQDSLAAVAKDIVIKTTDADEVILGYDGYDTEVDETTGKIKGYTSDASQFTIQVVDSTGNAVQVEDGNMTSTPTIWGYRWVENLEQLQAMSDNLDGNYALRNSIDAIETQDRDGGFDPIGDAAEAFTGKFDGLDYSIFGLQINRADEEYVGLFGYISGATIKNVTLVSGATGTADVTGGNYVGSVVGYAKDSEIINILNSSDVTGTTNVGGIVGYAENTTITDAINTATIRGYANVGGLVGSLASSTLTGTTYNLGSTYGVNSTDTTLSEDDEEYENKYYSHNIGGLVGYASASTIGNTADENGDVETVFNDLNVEGGYNVGGIVGTINDADATTTTASVIQNVANYGDITANGYINVDYTYNARSTNDGDIVTGTGSGIGFADTTDTTSAVAPSGTSQVHVSNVGGIVGSATGYVAGDTVPDVGNDVVYYTTIQDAVNNGVVSTTTVTDITGNYYEVTDEGTQSTTAYTYYIGGNVGGIVGSGAYININSATNEQTDVAGAHNVGGIVGSLISGDINSSLNSSSTVTSTGARGDNGFVMEEVRVDGSGSDEIFIIGNTGGIAGFTQDTRINTSANSGDVTNTPFYSVAGVTLYSSGVGNVTEHILGPANTGGIVGKINNTYPYDQSEIFSIQASYNTGTVQGYTNVGGVVGAMYNGSVGYSYNLGDVLSSRQSTGIAPLNMGGIVGDTYEETASNAYIYNCFNKGTIGDETYTYFGRHVGGIVGRLSGTVAESYNTGAVYNASTDTGGIVGWLYRGSVINSFNTGNITGGKINYNLGGYELGGIVGAASSNSSDIILDDTDNTVIAAGTNVVLTNVYNLGTITALTDDDYVYDSVYENESVGGILGGHSWGSDDSSVIIRNAYSIGSIIFATSEGDSYKGTVKYGQIYGSAINGTGRIDVTNAMYITSEDEINNANDEDTYYENTYVDGSDSDINHISYADSQEANNWSNFVTNSGTITIINSAGEEEEVSAWRTYNGTTPVINAFTTGALTTKYFETTLTGSNAAGTTAYLTYGDDYAVQYGNAYDPFLTIITVTGGYTIDGTALASIAVDWNDAQFGFSESLAVYNSGVTITDFVNGTNENVDSALPYGGTIYADGAVSITTASGVDVTLGTGSSIYGSSVTINSDADLTISGLVQATGNANFSNIDSSLGDVNITAQNVSITGHIASAYANAEAVTDEQGNITDYTYTIDGINSSMDISTSHSDVGSSYGHTVSLGKNADGTTYITGDINITAKTDSTDGTTSYGDVEVLYGNNKKGMLSAGDTVTITGGDVYVDSDLYIGGDLNIYGATIVLDGSNIGKVYYGEDTKATYNDTEIDAYLLGMYSFLDHFTADTNDGGGTITLDAVNAVNEAGERTSTADVMITVDLWDDDEGQFNLAKYDRGDESFYDYILKYNLKVNGEENDDNGSVSSEYTYIWIEDAEQLQGIQEYYDIQKSYIANPDITITNPDDTTVTDIADYAYNILNFNFALKNDIDASSLTYFVSIGTDATASDGSGAYAFTGTFDGCGNRIIGLTVGTTDADSTTATSQANAGLFNTIAVSGGVTDVRIYSSNVVGTTNAGLVAAVNYGEISDVTAYGNTIDVHDSTSNDGSAGGIVAVNYGTIDNATSQNTVMSSGSGNSNLGGIVGVNGDADAYTGATISNSESNSAITTSAGSADTVGGVAGLNYGKIDSVTSIGVTSGMYEYEDDLYYIARYTGGIVGYNASTGIINEAYNESIVNGMTDVGGIAGYNANTSITGTETITLTTITVTKNDDDTETITEEEETETITKYAISTVANAANIEGGDNVGGLVGTNNGSVNIGRNNGTITATRGTVYTRRDNNTLTISEGSNVGGLIGVNGTTGTLSDLTNDMSASIDGYIYVGGIVGLNMGDLSDSQNLMNTGSITGRTYVGGVAGVNAGTISGITVADDTTFYIYVKDDLTADKYAELEDVESSNSISALEAEYFGGIAGLNIGTISGAANTAHLVVDGAKYVGGVVGQNGLDYTTDQELTDALNAISTELTATGTDNDYTAKGKGTLSGSVYNSGRVTGTDYVGGVIGLNTDNSEITSGTIRNYGTVIATNGGAGGVIGENHADISGISMYNTGTVIGQEDVGGIIGYNTGEVKGGRDAADTYYLYRIYNNGRVIGSANGTTTVSETSQNIGGLIGRNAGTLTAAYNTGNVSGGTDVGGIVGENTGTVSQVFNTPATVATTTTSDDGNTTTTTTYTISGYSNVGGIIGTNSGTLSDAYNTGTVTGTTDVGNAVGVNTGTIYNIYATNDSGYLIGNNQNTVDTSYAYSYSTGDENATNIIVLDSEEEQNAKASYSDEDGGFNAGDDTSVWKFYDGRTTPLLSVFLTKATVTIYSTDEAKAALTYDANSHAFSIGDYTTNTDGSASVNILYGTTVVGTITVADADAVHSLQDYVNTKENSLSDLIQGITGVKDAGDYENFVYSEQINTGSGTSSPNNLGYDLVSIVTLDDGSTEETDPTANISKATISVALDAISRTYGNATIKNNSTTTDETGHVYVVGTDGYGYTISTTGSTLTDKMVEELTDAGFYSFTEDGAVKLSDGQTDTNNAGNYTWSASFTLNSDLLKNYQFVADTTAATTTASAASVVNKAALTITANSVTTTYGIAFDPSKYGYTITSSDIVNGDTDAILRALIGTQITSASYENEAAITDSGERVTANVGSDYSIDFNDAVRGSSDSLLNNYTVTFVAGTAKVTKADLVVTLADVYRTYGSTTITSGGYSLDENSKLALVNGDSGTIIVDSSQAKAADSALTGATTGAVTKGVGTYTWLPTEESAQLAMISSSNTTTLNLDNYNIKFEGGDSFISKATLYVQVNDVSTTYGTAFDPSKYGYTITSGNTNGDSSTYVNGLLGNKLTSVSYVNEGEGTNGKATADAGTYSIDFTDTAKSTSLDNYDIVTTPGTATVSKLTITLNADDTTITKGEYPNFTGDSLSDALTNGDTLADYGISADYGVENPDILTVVGTYDDSIILIYTFSDPAHREAFMNNYDIDVNEGDLTVLESRNSNLYDFEDKYDWGRKREYRERKAEVHYEDGGMVLEAK